MQSDELRALIRQVASEAKAASRVLATASTGQKNAVLLRAAAALRGPEGDALIAQNELDLAAAKERGMAQAMIDRLRLDRARVDGIAEGVEQVATLPDPVGEIVDTRKLSDRKSVV